MAKDIDGVVCMIEHLENDSDKIYIDTMNVDCYSEEDPLVILICMREICWGVTAYDFALFAAWLAVMEVVYRWLISLHHRKVHTLFLWDF